MEGAGIVEETNGVTGIEPGTLVSFFAGDSWAEYAAVSKDDLHVLPPDFPIEKAAQFALNAFTAWGLIERAAVNAGDWLLVTAANAAVSKLVVQICKHRGIHVIAVARKEFYRSELMQYGAVAMIDSTKESIEEQVRTITAGNGVHAVIDAVGGNTGTECIRTISTGGRMIIYGRLSDEPAQFYNADIVYKNISISGFGIRTYYKSKTTAQRQEITQALSDLLSLTSFKMEIAGSYKLHAFKKALQISGNEISGKRLFTPGDSKK